ncbi:hypothetical protein AB0368_06690 [Actinoplanes sp. NPDC051475]|uniref:hypothetical protein n=1 Tax=Actinoplanes sp. NPDC051475 TaxID=3157225 RepID=UPI00344CFDE5
MATDLHFSLPDVLRLAEHAVASRRHRRTYEETLTGTACPGAALEWVTDRGTYLTSNGRPRLLPDPHDDTTGHAVYAHGWGRDSDRRALARTDVGDNDFCKHLHLTGADGDPLLQMLRHATAAHYPWFVITVDGADLDVSCRTDGPTT